MSTRLGQSRPVFTYLSFKRWLTVTGAADDVSFRLNPRSLTLRDLVIDQRRLYTCRICRCVPYGIGNVSAVIWTAESAD